MVVPWGYFSDAKNRKPPTLSRKISGLRFFNLAVKERFEPSTIQAATVFALSVYAITVSGRLLPFTMASLGARADT